MAGTYTRWYREGTVKVTQNSTAVVGTSTYWNSAGLNPGDIFSLDGVTDYEILSISDATHLTLKSAYKGATQDGAAYHIIRNFTSHVPSQLAAQLADLYNDLARYWNQDTQTIHGKSAYEIACLHGYSGTEAEWIDFLRNGGGFTDLVRKTSNLETLAYRARYNCGFRGISLGNTVTAAQKEALCRWAGGKGDSNIIIGDHWDFTMPDGSTTIAYVAGFYTHYFIGPKQGQGLTVRPQTTLLLKNSSWQFPMHDSNDVSGGLAGTKMVTETLPALAKQIMPFFGDTLTSEYTLRVSSSIDANGVPTSWTNLTANLWLPCIENIWPTYESMNKDPGHYAEARNIRLPLIQYYPTILWDAKEYWMANCNGNHFMRLNRSHEAWLNGWAPNQTESHYIMPYMIIGPNWG